ncbi:MAG: methyltransferase domain-containing protein [Acidobacteria bacterium]|nr:methyltransferase domain-containing protein [Acidobacteriota bacterium]
MEQLNSSPPAAGPPGRAPQGASSRQLAHLYDRRYFHGQNSGYPSEGYAASHPDWAAWLEAISVIREAGRLVDLGCAYGYLVQEARSRGYSAFGIDISPYALSQLPSARPYVLQANLQAGALPLKTASADVVALFDILEHLNDPLNCLKEAVRLLGTEGLVVGTTPDPIFFQRSEATHLSEHPPSYWVEAMERLGLQVQFRFSGEAYNFQFVAAKRGSDTAGRLNLFQHDYIGGQVDILQVEGPLSAVLRHGWGRPEASGRIIIARPASVYLLNSTNAPLRARLKVSVLRGCPSFGRLVVQLGGFPLDELYFTSEKTSYALDCELLIPCGGQHLFFDTTPAEAQVFVNEIKIEATPAPRKALTLTLPFDLYSRYQHAAEMASILRPESILDVGGFLGDEKGHLAISQDFFWTAPTEAEKDAQQPIVRSTDLKNCDHPSHIPAPAWNQPFKDCSFDLLISLDVLEHIGGEQRVAYLAELDRVARNWIILGAPFDSQEVRAAEKRLSASVMQSHVFLREHSELGLPTCELVEQFFKNRSGYHILQFPNSHLLRWEILQILTQHYFQIRNGSAARQFNVLYNRYFSQLDRAEPCYRKIFLIAKQRLSRHQEQGLNELVGGSFSSFSELDLASFAAFHQHLHQVLLRRDAALSDLQFLINEREKLIEILQSRRHGRKTFWRSLGTAARALFHRGRSGN